MVWQRGMDFYPKGRQKTKPGEPAVEIKETYTVRQKKNGEYSGELLISRKESSKTLTKSSKLLALQRVLDHSDSEPPMYAGPKAIGQIFGISYIYSLFWKWNLIRVPEKVEKRLRGKR